MSVDYINNGIMTKIWGPPGWLFLHCVTQGYPNVIDTTNEAHVIRREQTKIFFESLAEVLPCKYCRQSYKKYLEEIPIDDHLSTRVELCKWLYDIHNKVNEKLGIQEVPDFEKVYERYEMFRSKCGDAKLGCVKSKDGVKKKSVIKIIDKEGNDYCINTTNDMQDANILREYNQTKDCGILKLLTENSKYKLKISARYCIENNQGNINEAKKIIKNL